MNSASHLLVVESAPIEQQTTSNGRFHEDLFLSRNHFLSLADASIAFREGAQ